MARGGFLPSSSYQNGGGGQIEKRSSKHVLKQGGLRDIYARHAGFLVVCCYMKR